MRLFISILFMMIAFPAAGLPATINLDRGIKVGALWCFPSIEDNNNFYWLPSSARLAVDDSGVPIFSFVAYTLDEKPQTAQAQSITRAIGGGVLHFVIEYGNSESDLNIAEGQLKHKMHDKRARLVGPVLFDHGQYMLVSSVLNQTGKSRAVLKSGQAPVIAGNRIAMSFQMDLDQAELLMRNFESATPDVSVAFDLAFSGYSQSYNAELIVDWDKIRVMDEKHSESSFLFWGSQVDTYLDDLRENFAFKLVVYGSDTNHDALLDYVYQKLADLLFQSAPPAQYSGGGGSFTLFGSNTAYIRREIDRKGKSVFNLNRKELSKRYSTIVWNLGRIYKKYGSDPQHFRIVHLGDDAFKLRHLRVIVDAELVPEFEKTLNLVTVSIKKEHGDGKVFRDEVVIDNTMAESMTKSNTNPPVLVYPWRKEKNFESWLSYSYRLKFSFQGGGRYESNWIENDSAGIIVYTPYHRQIVTFVGDVTKLKKYNIRAINVSLAYPFFGEIRKTHRSFLTDSFSGQEKVEIILPKDQTKLNYQIIFYRAGNTIINRRGIWLGNIIFIDDVLMAHPGG